jgi:hypothetical protein
MKKIITLIALSCLLAPSSTILADTYDTGSWTSGDGTTEVSAAIEPSYEVTIPETLTLPHSASYTDATNNVAIQAGAQIPKGHVISVSLASGQTFSATYADESTTVPYKVKINTNDGIANTTGGAVSVLTANADVAHDTGATATMKVGFDSAPNFKYAGTYTDSVQFEVRAGLPIPAPGTQIMIGGEAFNYVKAESGRYLVVQAGNAGTVQYNSSPAYVPYENSIIKGQVDSWFNNKFTSYSNDANDSMITVDGYTIYKTTLNGATSNNVGDSTNWENETFQNGYLSKPYNGSETDAISAYAFVISKADLNAQTAGGGTTPESIRAANGSYIWTRSPGSEANKAAGVDSSGNIVSGDVNSYGITVKAAFWVSIDALL